MPRIQSKIWFALRARVESLVLIPELPIIWPSQSRDIPSGRCLEVIYMPNRPRRLFLGSTDAHERRGILQIGLLSELNAASQYQENFLQQIAGDIAAHFPCDLPMTYDDITVKVYEAPEVAPAFKDDARKRFVHAVRIRWELFA